MQTIRLMKYGRTIFSLAFGLLFTGVAHAQPLKVCATVPELGSLVQEIGCDRATVTVFAKGTEDPHFLIPKPSYIKALSTCDVYIQGGLDLEVGWAPRLLQNARNPDILPGGRGYIDASVAITPLGVPTVTIDRSMGHVHALGNPHYLLDPLNGLRVARLLRDRLSAMHPGSADYFSQRYQDFRYRLGTALVGETLFNKYDFEKLAVLAERGRLGTFLKSQREESLLAGWLGQLSPYRGSKVVSDHQGWPYFAQRFGLDIVERLESLPGVLPTTQHLNEVITLMKAQGVKVVLATAYYDPRYAQFVSENTGAAVVHMAHQPGARPDTGSYLSMVDYNIKQLTAAFGEAA